MVMVPLDLICRIVHDAPLSSSPIHGVDHWQTVAQNGLGLIEAGADADPKIVVMFALLHDACRADEDHDPDHGPRAATYMRRLYREGLIDLPRGSVVTLSLAIRNHADGEITDDPTIGVCWDADRLDLPRVDLDVDPAYLSTPQALRVARRI